MKTSIFKLTVTNSSSVVVPDTNVPLPSDVEDSDPLSSDTNKSQSTTEVLVPNTGYSSGVNNTVMAQRNFDVGTIVLTSLIATAIIFLIAVMLRCRKRAKVGFGKVSRGSNIGMGVLLGLAIVLTLYGIGRVINNISGEVNAADFDAFSVSSIVEVNAELDGDRSVRVCGTAKVTINEDLSNGFVLKIKASELQLISDSSVKIPSLAVAGDLQENAWGYRLKGGSTLNPIPTEGFVSIKDTKTAIRNGSNTDVEYCTILSSSIKEGIYESSISYEVMPYAAVNPEPEPDPGPDPDPDPEPEPDPEPAPIVNDLPIRPIYDSSVDIPCDSRTIDRGEAEGYSNGTKVMIRLCAVPNMVDVDGSPVDDNYIVVNSRVSGAFYAFNEAHKARYGNYLTASEGFRTNEEQEYFYNCYLTGDCNGGNVAAAPGYSNHQMGLAIDFGTAGFYNGNTSLCEWAGSGCHLNSSFLAEFGLRDGRSFGENWHIEAVGD